MQFEYFKSINELMEYYEHENVNTNYFVSHSIESHKSVTVDVNDFVCKLSSLILKEMKITRRSDLTFLELKFPDVDSTEEIFNKFYDSATILTRLYKNFEGCQVINIDSWINNINSERFKEFLEHLRRNTSTTRFIIKAKILNEEVGKKVLAMLSTAIEITPVFIKDLPEDKTLDKIIESFENSSIELDYEAKRTVQEWLMNYKLKPFLDQPNGLQLLNKAILTIVSRRCKPLQKNQIRVITKQDLINFEKHLLAFIDYEEVIMRRKIGF